MHYVPEQENATTNVGVKYDFVDGDGQQEQKSDEEEGKTEGYDFT